MMADSSLALNRDSPLRLSSPKLLLADAPGPFRDVIEHFVAGRGIEVRCATGHPEIALALRDSGINIVLLDPVTVGLDVEQGLELRRVAERWNVPVLTLTTVPPPAPEPGVLVKGHFTLEELWGEIRRRLEPIHCRP